MTLLREIQKEKALTLLVSLHQVDFARRYADRIIGLCKGSIVFDGPPKHLDDTALRKIYDLRPDGDVISPNNNGSNGLALAHS